MTISNEQWVKDALAFFGRNLSYFAFLVIVMDNLDQSPLSSQREAIRIAKNLVRDHALSLYRIIIPLWPNSFDTLAAAMQPWEEEATRFELPGLDSEEYYKKRFDPQNAVTDAPADDVAWAQSYARDFYNCCRTNFFHFFDSFSGDDIRFRQKLVIATLTNPSLIGEYNAITESRDKSKDHPERQGRVFRQIGEYLNFSSLLAGECDGHQRDLSPVANMFYASETDEKLNQLLGIHLLWLLDCAPEDWIKGDFIKDYLQTLGHKDGDIDQATGYFVRKEILRSPQVLEPERYFINYDSVKSYLYSVGELPYLDNMAMVTPVSAKRLPKITVTRSNKQFMKRKQSTLEFLDEIREVESEWFTEADPPPSLQQFIGVKCIPSVFLTLCESYRVNDETARGIQKIKNLISSADWNVLTKRFKEITRSSYTVFEGRIPWPKKRAI